MAQLDRLLEALVVKKAQALIMAEGQPATFQLGGSARPVSQKSLDRTQIARLLAELSGELDAARLAGGEPASFVYSLPSGESFLCQVAVQADAMHARVTPRPAEDPPSTEPDPESAIPVAPAQETASPAEVPIEPAPPREIAAPAPVAPTDEPAIHRYLRQLVDAGASDLHLSSNEVPMQRLDGEMSRVPGGTRLSPEEVGRLLEPIMPERSRVEYDETHDTDFAHEIPGLARFRVNVFADRHGIGSVLRVIPSKILTAEQLGLPKAVLDLCRLSKGLVVCTGPTGSGKSTTLAAMVDFINQTRSDHIITIEDPVEFVHPNRKCLVNQREVVTHTTGFKRALRAALREDPDIVLVGEMRDLETIAIAIETAETGHLVFGTLHTTTAVSTVDRIIDQFPADRQSQIRTMLSESIKGVIAQNLIKKIGGGRVAAMEVLIVTPAIANMIREGKTFQIPSLMQTGRKHGMVLLNDALVELVKSKTVAPEDAFRVSVDKAGFTTHMNALGIKLEVEAS